MADNTILLPGGGGDTIATDDIGGIKFPRSKITLGADGVNNGDISAANPMPVTGTITVNVGLTDTELRASAVPVTGPLTDAQLRALAVPVSGTFFQATQPVSGPLTDAQLRATPVPVSGTVTANLGVADNALLTNISGSVVVDSSPYSVGVSRVELSAGEVTDGMTTVAQGIVTAISLTTSRETRVFDATSSQSLTSILNALLGTITISGSVTGPLTDAQLRASAVPVSLSTVAVTNAGTFPVQAAQSGTWTVQIGNTPNTTPILVSQRPATSGGLSVSSFLSTAAVQATAVKASAGQIYSLSFFNKGAAAVYLRLYNMTTTPGTGDTPVWRGIIPGNTAGAGLVKQFPSGLEFSSGIGFRCTGAIADNDATVLAANEVTGNIEYK